ncbi:helix-turn-helix transcriptional regulator [Streptomyces griseorubiginosus]|uniref:helix-turn-helix transcriptional regulator n=1 Tax=Streptomyces griseorubiginosus TaxID=67304 RepID=UPI002E803381|nr:AAA family ATPase [Streptomyces griseorubiginosus]WUB49790.1 AAA family ATPase [Streptomyces griseorubiginosus]WUB58319.1 AAA family ATPase [Streptomyces griseorubiginosus]
MTADLLDRDEDVALLRQGVSDALSGSHGFLAISAPAGLGKSRLLKEAGTLAREAGLRVLSARGSELEREYSLGLVQQLYEPLLHSCDPADRDRWLADAARPAGSVLGVSGTDAETVRGEFAVLHGLFWLTSNLCQDGPLALVVDDLHWGDEASLRFLAYLLPRLPDLRLLLVVALRPGEPGAAEHLIDLLLADQECTLLHPTPLGPEASGLALTSWFGETPDAAFAAACHEATGGNPLLLRELSRALVAEGLSPARGSVPQVEHLGSRALQRRVAREIGRLQPDAVRLAQAVAVLGPRAHPAHAASLAGLDPALLGHHLADLHSAHLLTAPQHGEPGDHLDFVHPLVRATVHRGTPLSRRADLHARAAALLTASGARPELAAEHLLHVPPAHDADTVTALRDAARHALGSGAAEAALTYLRRALEEPPPRQERITVLTEAGTAAFLTDLPAAKRYLDEAADLAVDPRTRGGLATIRELVYLLGMQDPDHTVTGVRDVLESLPAEEDDLRRTLEALLLAVPLVTPGWTDLLRQLPRLRALAPSGTMGALALDGMIAICDAYAGDPRCVETSRRVVADPRVRQAAADGGFLFMNAAFPLVVHDPDKGVAACETLVAGARATGSLLSLSALQGFRGFAWLQRGDLAEAAGDLEEALGLATTAHTPVQQYALTAWLAETLLEQGLAARAEAVVEQALQPSQNRENRAYGFLLYAHACVLHGAGSHEAALKAALDAGADFTGSGGHNPAILPWQTLAALCLHALGRTDEGLDHARRELDAARRWASPRAEGRALRTVGLLTPGSDGIGVLTEAERLLRPSSARLEHAKTLVGLGAAVRRSNQRSQARTLLGEGMELAHRCGARLLVDHARTELRAAGARPRTPRQTGPEALTPSETRAARMAATGLTNRQIAQQLFVTTKTVEVHLSAVYRKLDISHRSQLATALADTS